MRSYYAHLETAAAGQAKALVAPKPVFRSSAIFPVFQSPGISSRVLFMGYWILKRDIREIACVATIRTMEGRILTRSHFLINEAKTYRLEIIEKLEEAEVPLDKPFIGSIEVEFYSTANLFFPYPAVVINYYGPNFSSVVHTAQRVYNDFDDWQKNSQTEVPESGFNIYADEDREPFIALINGAAPVEQSKVKMEFFSSGGNILKHELDLGNLAPFQTSVIYPAREAGLQKFLDGKPGAAKVYFHVNWIFPRLVVGNIQKSLSALSITHTYYDCTKAADDSDYWRPAEPKWHPASLLVPLSIVDDHFTNVYLYPIYSPCHFALDIEVYDRSGELLGGRKGVLDIQSPGTAVQKICFVELCKELKIQPQRNLGARIIARTLDGGQIPARIKLGLDMGSASQKLPCNICTNLQPFNPSIENKPKSFRWAPILADQPNASVWIMNSAPNVHYDKTAEIELSFFREKDAKTLQRRLLLPPHGFAVLWADEDEELKKFFNSSIGWMTATSNNPYTTTYYFVEHPSGIVGGDHGF